MFVGVRRRRSANSKTRAHHVRECARARANSSFSFLVFVLFAFMFKRASQLPSLSVLLYLFLEFKEKKDVTMSSFGVQPHGTSAHAI